MFATTSTATFAPVAPRASRRCKKTVCAAKKQQDGGHWLAEGVAVIFTPADSHGIKWTEISPMGFSPYSSTVMPTKSSKKENLERQATAAWSLAKSRSKGHPGASAFALLGAALGDASVPTTLLNMEEDEIGGMGKFIVDGMAQAVGKLDTKKEDDLFKGTGMGWTGDVKKKSKI